MQESNLGVFLIITLVQEQLISCMELSWTQGTTFRRNRGQSVVCLWHKSNLDVSGVLCLVLLMLTTYPDHDIYCELQLDY